MFTTPRGTHDILPDDWSYWSFVLDQASTVAHLFGHRRIETPTFAETSLFVRTTGKGTDIVDKEMYNFEDRDGNELTLRPEGTAPVMRAYLQHGMNKLPQPVRLYYLERVFRYDRPQRGRVREHHQFGAETMGSEDARLDVEIIALLAEFFARLGLTGLSLHVNSIGDRNCRPKYVKELVAYLRDHEDQLSQTDRDRISRNPLRVLDSKEAPSQRVIEGAPALLDRLCDDCRLHWNQVLHGLEILRIPYSIDHRLVRGLDYYTRTVFEFEPPDAGAQGVLGGGGRYDALSEAMGGPAIPGVGFGCGIERVILAMQDQGVEVPPLLPPDAFVAYIGDGPLDEALRLTSELRRANVAALMGSPGRSLKAQMRQANASGARFVAILGEDELAHGTVKLRSLATGEEEEVPRGQVVSVLGGIKG